MQKATYNEVVLGGIVDRDQMSAKLDRLVFSVGPGFELAGQGILVAVVAEGSRFAFASAGRVVNRSYFVGRQDPVE